MFRIVSKDLKMVKVTSFRDSLQIPSQNGHDDCRCLSTRTASGKPVNHYKLLGVASDSTPKEIKQAYYRLSKVYHPDVNKSESASKQFQIISEAYEILSNELTRRQYDIEMGIIRGDRPLRHGQQKYQPRGTPPTGMSSTYNFDEWYKQHYTSSFNRGQEDKRKQYDHEEALREEMKAYTDSKQYKMDDLTKSTYFLVAVATVAFIIKRFLK